MVLDILVEGGVPIAFARTQVRPRLLEPGSRLGEAIGATRVTAALELVELMHLAGGEAAQYSIEVFAPGSIDLHVIRGSTPGGGKLNSGRTQARTSSRRGRRGTRRRCQASAAISTSAGGTVAGSTS